MIKLKRFWIDLTRPSEWMLVLQAKSILWKIKDYDRIEYDYSCVLDHATNSRMSKTNYYIGDIVREIDSAQQESYYGTVKDDVNELIDNGATLDEIKEYVNSLA